MKVEKFYIANDGKRFNEAKDCLAYESELKFNNTFNNAICKLDENFKETKDDKLVKSYMSKDGVCYIKEDENSHWYQLERQMKHCEDSIKDITIRINVLSYELRYKETERYKLNKKFEEYEKHYIELNKIMKKIN